LTRIGGRLLDGNSESAKLIAELKSRADERFSSSRLGLVRQALETPPGEWLADSGISEKQRRSRKF